MSYQVLARKYRPATFDAVVGQDAITRTLRNAVTSGRIAHAYLFAGPRGIGKTTTARLLARALLCPQRKDAEPCGQCEVCRDAHATVDIIEIDGASNRGIEEIRNLRENVKYAASGGGFKVYIIDEAHQLTDFAWNALLKTLEEPPAHVKFVFCTTEPLEVPDTIASRCQVFEFRRLRSEELVKHLLDVAGKEKVALDPDAAGLIARASEGSVRDALGRLDQALAVSPDGVTAATVAQALGLVGLDAYFDLGEALAKRDPKTALEVLDRLHDAGSDVEEIADGMTHHLRQLLLIAVDASLTKLVDAAPSDRERYAAQAKEFKPTDLNAMLALILETRGLLRKAEAPRILLEVTLVEMCTLPTSARIEDLIQRLTELEGKLGGGAEPRRPAASAPDVSSPPPQQTPRRGSAPPETPRATLVAHPAVATAEAPAPEPTPTPAPMLRLVESPDSSDPVVRWRNAVDRVKERKLLLGTCLEEGFFLGMAGSSVRLALSAEHAFHRAMLEMKENREILNEELERLYGRGARLLCESTVPPGATPLDAAVRTEAARETTLVDRIVELFDGEVMGPGPGEGNV